MRVEFDPALQSTIDTVLAPKKPRLDRQAHGFAVLAPAAMPRSARRVRFSVDERQHDLSDHARVLREPRFAGRQLQLWRLRLLGVRRL